jgi:D-tyrosyl-tRNA(Tyr) deacylase
MRAVVQRVKRASVTANGALKGEIGKGLLVYVGVQKGDTATDLEYIAAKILGLRVFEDPDGKMNLDILEVGGEVLLISQFTLAGDCRKGRRPSFDGAEPPHAARLLYDKLCERLGASIRVSTGEFQAHMEVESINDGPVTMLLDSKKLF